MILQKELNKEDFLNKLATLKNALINHQLINENLEIENKWGFRWIILCLLHPFFALFGKDAFSHVRVNKVAINLFQYFKANKAFLDETTIKKFNEKFISPLIKKTI